MKITLTYILSSLLFFASQAQQANWQSLGPIAFPTNVSGQINGIGRTTQLKFHPTNANIVYATTASGGLYKSVNQGNSWQVLGTDSMPQTQMASVCIDFTDDNILYLGTGDPNYYSNGIGVWKSTDGGATFFQSNTGIGNRLIVELLMDPTQHETIIAATNDGIFKTTDAGATWVEKLSSGDFTDMVKQPGSNSVYYAVTTSNFYRSNDAGETWTQITNGIAVPGGGSGNGLRVAVCTANPNVVYVGMVKDEGTIFKSTDAGLSFSTVYHNPAVSLVGYDEAGGGQGNYNFDLGVDPTNPDVVFVVSHCVWRSNDGGINWNRLTDWWAVVHTDMHYIDFSPFVTNKMFTANDGGVWTSTDLGNSWTINSDGLEATECYHAANSLQKADIVSIGTQDNGELYAKNNSWYTNRGGDWGSVMTFDFLPQDNVYYLENGERRNPVTGGNQDFGLPTSEIGNAAKISFTPSNPSLAFAGRTGIYRTQNLEGFPPDWELINTPGGSVKDIQIFHRNPNIVVVAMSNKKLMKSTNALDAAPTFTAINVPGFTSLVASLAIDKANDNIMYCAMNSRVYRTYDNGTNWEDISGTLPFVNAIRLVMDSARNDESVYLATAQKVYYRNNTMTDWVDYSSGLPTVANIKDLLIFDDGSVSRNLRVAYYGRGVFEADLYSTVQCQAPDAPSAQVDGNTNVPVTVSWSGGNGNSYSLQYRMQGSLSWNTVQSTTSSATLPLLESCKSYEVRVASTCSVERSFYSESTQFTIEGQQLGADWTVGDIGGNSFQGYHCFNPNRQEVSITSAGSDVWNGSDQFYYISKEITGDAEIVARVTSIERKNGWAKCGVMVRNSRNANASHAFMGLTPDNGAAYQWRANTAGGTANTNIPAPTPSWVKLKRVGNVLEGYTSADGLTWTLVEAQSIALGAACQFGVFSTSHEETIANTVVIDNISMFDYVNGVKLPVLVDFQLNVFPNPVQNTLNISANIRIEKIEIFDVAGNLIESKVCNHETIEFAVTHLSAGVYVVACTLQDGTTGKKTFEKVN